MTAGRVLLLLFVVRAGMGVGRKQQNDRRPGLIVAFYRGSRNGSWAEATKWPQAGSYCCFLSWKQERDLGGSNKMAAGRVPLLLFIVRAGMEVGRKQQNDRRPGLIVAFCGESRNGSWAEATKWLQARSHCCFLSWKQEWELGGSSKMAAGRVPLLLFKISKNISAEALRHGFQAVRNAGSP